VNSVGPHFGPWPRGSAWPARASSAQACPWGGHHAQGARSGAAGGSSPMASTRRGLHLEHRRRAVRRPGKVVGTGTHRGGVEAERSGRYDGVQRW
jgi:hypothetical protein